MYMYVCVCIYIYIYIYICAAGRPTPSRVRCLIDSNTLVSLALYIHRYMMYKYNMTVCIL